MFVQVLVGTVLVSGAWGHIALTHGQETVVPKRSLSPLPQGGVDFEGFLVGTVLSTDEKTCVLKVTKAIPVAGSKATDPSVLVGKNTRVAYIAYGPGEDDQYAPDEDLARAVAAHSAEGQPIIVKVFAAREKVLMINKVWPGDGSPARPRAR